jgi:hypothetical protein
MPFLDEAAKQVGRIEPAAEGEEDVHGTPEARAV